MLIYVIYDHQKKTISHPMVVEDLQVAKDALREMNPENYQDLIVHGVCALNSTSDLFKLSVNPERELPHFLKEFPQSTRGDFVSPHPPISPELASGAPSEAR